MSSAVVASPSVGPWEGFVLAADAAVADLSARFGLDLWMVTHVNQDRQLVVASSGSWTALAPPGAVFSWTASFCLQMVSALGPVVEPDVQASSTLAATAVGELERVRAYVGVPLLSTPDGLFGTLCAFAGSPQPAGVRAVLPHVQLTGRMLSTILAGERIAAERSQEAADAYALAERDRLTGLRNRRGWEVALRAEEQRARRHGSPVSVVVLDLDDLKMVNDAAGHAAGDSMLVDCAAVLTGTCRPHDSLARTGGDEFGLLVVECDPVSARALTMRLRVALRSAGVAASVGWATRRPGEQLAQTWQRADEAMYHDKRRRRPGAPS